MKTNPSLVKQKLPLGKGDAWIEVTSSHFAFVDFRAHPDGIECLRVKTETTYQKQRAIDALRSAADFLESEMDAVETPPCDRLPSAIAALNGVSTAAVLPERTSPNVASSKRTLSPAGRANIVRAAKTRWAKIRAAKAKKAK